MEFYTEFSLTYDRQRKLIFSYLVLH